MNETTDTGDVEYEYVYEYVEVSDTDDLDGVDATGLQEADVLPDALPVSAEGGRPQLLKTPIRWFTWFRRTRPFWGAVILGFGAYFVGDPLLGGGFSFAVTVGAAAIIPMSLAFIMGAAAVISVALPKQRHFPAIVAMLASIASLPLANLGGFLVGMLCGIIGSGLIFSWAPYSDKQLERFAAKAADKAERRAAKKGLKTDALAPA